MCLWIIVSVQILLSTVCRLKPSVNFVSWQVNWHCVFMYVHVCIYVFQLEVITEEWLHYRAAVLSEKLLETEFTTRNRGRI